jgi:hypothetical protein
MNIQDELELLIRGCHPVLTIISNKETWVPDMAEGFADKRSNKSSGKAAASATSKSATRRRSSVQRAGSGKNDPAFAGRSVN